MRYETKCCLEQSPFSFHKKLMTAFTECGDYFKELSEYKSKQMASGLSAEKGTMDLMGKLSAVASRNRS